MAVSLCWPPGRPRRLARLFSELMVSLKPSSERGTVWVLDRKKPSLSFGGLPDSIVDMSRFSGTSDWASG